MELPVAEGFLRVYRPPPLVFSLCLKWSFHGIPGELQLPRDFAHPGVLPDQVIRHALESRYRAKSSRFLRCLQASVRITKTKKFQLTIHDIPRQYLPC